MTHGSGLTMQYRYRISHHSAKFPPSGTSTTGEATVHRTGGYPQFSCFETQDALGIFDELTNNINGVITHYPMVGLLIADRKGICSLLQQSEAAPPHPIHASIMRIMIHSNIADAPVPPGTYSVVADHLRLDIEIITDCPRAEWSPVSGTVTFDTISSTKISGRFDLDFVPPSPLGHMTGDFSTLVC